MSHQWERRFWCWTIWLSIVSVRKQMKEITYNRPTISFPNWRNWTQQFSKELSEVIYVPLYNAATMAKETINRKNIQQQQHKKKREKKSLRRKIRRSITESVCDFIVCMIFFGEESIFYTGIINPDRFKPTRRRCLDGGGWLLWRTTTTTNRSVDFIFFSYSEPRSHNWLLISSQPTGRPTSEW